MSRNIHITILGGGPAGLAAAYYAKKRGLSFTVYESSGRIGGNTATQRHGDFLFDLGAHRFHDKDSEITRELRNLIGEDFKKIEVPSKVYWHGKLIDFPLSPLDLLKKMGFITFTGAGFQLLTARMSKRKKDMNFEELALRRYGKTIAESFLLNYSEKLWGKPCSKLSADISGARMKGLDLTTFLKEALKGSKAKVRHLDGAFYYPRMGFGVITEKLAEFCGEENICRNASVTRVIHDCRKIVSIEINGRKRIEVDRIISTLPLPNLTGLMLPLPPEEVLSLADGLQFRNLIVIAIFLDKDSVTEDGSIYFPESKFPFTRVYEPKNRSRLMSPPGKTSLCAEIPCSATGEPWNMDDTELFKSISSQFLTLGWIREEDILDFKVMRLERAYPVLEKGYEEISQRVTHYAESFGNLQLSGRNGRFLYTHMHDMMRFGMNAIERCLLPEERKSAPTSLCR
jgi:protoporphyrinogen oxidase